MKVNGQMQGSQRKELEGYIKQTAILTMNKEREVAAVLATNVAYGFAIKDAKLATEAAAALAKLSNQPLEAANQVILQAIAGDSRALTKLVPAVNELTQARMRQAGAVDVINEKNWLFK